MFYPPNFSLGFADSVAILVFVLSVMVSIINIGLYKKNEGFKKRWIFVYNAVISLFMGTQYLLAGFDIWGAGGKPNLYLGRIGVIFLLTSLGVTSLISGRRC